MSMQWEMSWRTDPRARALADRHYSRQTPGAEGFVPPGRCLVLVGLNRKAYWVTSWPFAEYVKHEWAGAWVCSAFRNEGEGPLASELIRQALAVTMWNWPDPPCVPATGGDVAMITFVDETKVRRKRTPGRCFIKAGFRVVGMTKGGLLALGISPNDLPRAERPVCGQIDMWKVPS